MNGVFVALNRDTVPYSLLVGIYRLSCLFMGNRLVCETRLLGRQQCASVRLLMEALEQITQCPVISPLTFNYLHLNLITAKKARMTFYIY